MSKFWVKTLAIIFDLTLMFLCVATPFVIGIFIHHFFKPYDLFTVIAFVIIWIVLNFILYALALFLIKVLRYYFDVIHNLLEEIEEYKRNK